MNDKVAKVFFLIFGVIILAFVFGFMALLAKWEKGKPASVENEMTNLVVCLASYHAIFGSFPTGSNARVMSALCGENPRKMLLDPIGPRRRARTNEALDIWQTAYEFRFESNSMIIVSSAGKNGRFGDDDDLMVGVALSDTNFPFMKLPPQITNAPAQN